MNPILTIDSARGARAVYKAPAITSSITKSEKSGTGAIFTRMRASVWCASAILKVFAGVLAVLYMLGAIALSAGLLFYTFIR